jgi:O-antigen/teichoic acid export membrane protein
MHPFRPRLSFVAWRRLLHFSSWIWVYSIVAFANSQGAILIAGRLIEPRALGLFKVGSEVGGMPASEIQLPILRVLFPGLARAGDDPARFARLLVEAFSTMLLLQTAVSVGFALVARPLVGLLYGDSWTEMVGFVSFVAISTLLQFPSYLAEATLVAAGLVRTFSGLTAVSAAIRLPLLATGFATGGLIGAGWMIVVSCAIEGAVFTTALARGFDTRVAELFRGAWRNAISAAVMTGAVLAVRETLPAAGGELAAATDLIASVFAGAVAFVMSQVLLWILSGRPEGAEANLWRLLRQRALMVGAGPWTPPARGKRGRRFSRAPWSEA